MQQRHDALLIWRQKNPLRRWRERWGYSMRTAAPMIGTSMNSIQDWEQGQYVPSRRSFAKITSSTEINMDDWMRWWENRPS